MTRYRSRFDTVTQPWERAIDNHSYVGRHGINWWNDEARRIEDRRRACIVLDQAVDNASCAQDWLVKAGIRSDVIMSAGLGAA